MGFTHIVIRDETADALKAWLKKAHENKWEVETSLSDVIDALMLDITGMDEAILLEQIERVAKQN